MTCVAAFTVSDGVTTVTVGVGSVAAAYAIGRELITDGVAPFRGADGSGALDVRFEKYRYSISGSGPADPGLYALDLTSDSWTVTIPGFADGSASEVWTVVPARPTQTRDRIGNAHSWTLTVEDA